jgi:hypothetical protein
MNETPYIKYCLKKIEEKLNWGNNTQWTDSDFKNLSDVIQNISGILVSSHTLKRLYGKVKYKTNYNPQLATKDALSKYIGYKSWNDFKSEIGNQNVVLQKIPDNSRRTRPISILKLKHGSYYFGFGFIAIVIAVFIVLESRRDSVIGPYIFEVQNPVGKAPHTANFIYDISELGTGNAFIDFDHISNKGVYLTNSLNQDAGRISRCFHFPGKYDVKLFVDNRIVYRSTVLVESDDWFYYAIEPYSSWNKIPDVIKPTVTKRYREVKFDNVLSGDFISNGYMHIPHSSITKIEGLSGNYKTHHVKTRLFNISLDSCIFEIRFRNEQFGDGIHCYEASFELMGMNGSIDFQIVESGCENYAYIRAGSNYKIGETENLKDFEMDFLDFQTLKIQVKDNRVQLFREDEMFFKTDYDNLLGELVGIHLSSKGNPHYDWIRIQNLEGNTVYVDGFD